jgi:ATP synthase protein I
MFFFAAGLDKAKSAILGGTAAFIPNLYFALSLRRVSGQQAKKIVRAFYSAESGKLILTAALFVMIFQVPGLEIWPLIVCYTAALSVFWFALLMR